MYTVHYALIHKHLKIATTCDVSIYIEETEHQNTLRTETVPIDAC